MQARFISVVSILVLSEHSLEDKVSNEKFTCLAVYDNVKWYAIPLLEVDCWQRLSENKNHWVRIQ